MFCLKNCPKCVNPDEITIKPLQQEQTGCQKIVHETVCVQAQQYQVLYAQLLAAKLNVLNLQAQGVPICTFATEAIAAADAFLDNSPEGGMSGAPNVQEDLEQFNAGNAPGCPPQCEDDNNNST